LKHLYLYTIWRDGGLKPILGYFVSPVAFSGPMDAEDERKFIEAVCEKQGYDKHYCIRLGLTKVDWAQLCKQMLGAA
jgi:hypothetical protein